MPVKHARNQRVSLLLITLSALILLLLSPLNHGAGTAPVDKTIQHLIDHVADSDVVFVRNARKYSGKDAAEHMQKKYAHFKDEIQTPEDFIELCASRSLVSGNPYLVINENGETVLSAEWLAAELQRYNEK